MKEKQLKYLSILNQQRNSGFISEKKYKKELKFVRKITPTDKTHNI